MTIDVRQHSTDAWENCPCRRTRQLRRRRRLRLPRHTLHQQQAHVQLTFIYIVNLTQVAHSNGALYSNTVIGTLAVDGWAVTFGTARKGLGGLGPCPVPSSLYQM